MHPSLMFLAVHARYIRVCVCKVKSVVVITQIPKGEGTANSKTETYFVGSLFSKTKHNIQHIFKTKNK